MKLARYIYAIGGAGKELIYEMFNKDWILEEILKPEYSPTNVNIIIIDTAIDEENDDLEKINNIKTKINDLTQNFLENMPINKSTGSINIEYKLITKDMLLNSPADLVGIGKQVKTATGASVWWINDDKLKDKWRGYIIKEGNFEALNFALGVYRRRAIAKAIYYKALAGGKFNVFLPKATTIDIIAGLGGGTGSGIAIDLAKKLKSIQSNANITLFGILSTLAENPDEKANCFAMLSELEYQHLNMDKIFNNIILVPIERTGFTGKIGAPNAKVRELLKEFDESFPYVMISYHNSKSQSKISNHPKFAPFCIAVPQLIRYNIEFIKQFRKELEETLSDKEDSLDYENKIFNEIRSFVDRFWKNNKNNTLLDDDKSFITERFNRLEKILNYEFFEQLDYVSIKSLKKSVEDGKNNVDKEDIENIIENIMAQIEGAGALLDIKDDLDKNLYDILKREIININQLIFVFKEINKIEDNTIKTIFKDIVKNENENLGNAIAKINSIINKKKDAKTSIENKIYTQKKHVYILKSIDNLIEELKDKLEDDFQKLEQELTTYINNLQNLESEEVVDNFSDQNVQDAIQQIKKDMNSVGLNYDDNDIQKDIILIKGLRKNQITANRKISGIDRTFRNRKYRRKIEAEHNVNITKTKINAESKVFRIGEDGTFKCIYSYDFEADITKNEKNIINEILNQFIKRQPRDDMEKCLIMYINKKNIKPVVECYLKNREGLIAMETEVEKYDKDKDEIEKFHNKFDAFHKTINDIKDKYIENYKHIKKYENYINNLGQKIAFKKPINEEIYYITQKRPKDLFRAIRPDADINNIIFDATGKDTIEKNLLKKDIIQAFGNTINNQYNLLLKRTFVNTTNEKTWNNSSIMSSLVTKAKIPSNIANQYDDISKAFSIDTNKYSEDGLEYGDKWSVGVCLIINSVFLDNIKNVVDTANGYYTNYCKMKKSNSIRTSLHHSYLLEEGKFVYRNKIFNLENNNDRDSFLEDDDEIEKMIKGCYETINLKDIAEELK